MNITMIIPPIVLILVEAFKKTKLVADRWLPFLALGCGLLVGTIFAFVEPVEALRHMVNGFLYGAASAGLYDAGKSALGD